MILNSSRTYDNEIPASNPAPKTKGDLQSFQRRRAKWLSHRHPRSLIPSPEDVLRHRLVDFYTKHCPSKLEDESQFRVHVDKVLEKYKGKETELFQKLEQKYLNVKKNALAGQNSKFPIPKWNPEHSSSCYLDIRIGNDATAAVSRLEIQLYDDIVPLAAENFRCLCTGEKVCLQ